MRFALSGKVQASRCSEFTSVAICNIATLGYHKKELDQSNMIKIKRESIRLVNVRTLMRDNTCISMNCAKTLTIYFIYA